MKRDNTMAFNELDFSGTLESSNVLVVGAMGDPGRSVAAHLAAGGANVLLVTSDCDDLDNPAGPLGDGIDLCVADASTQSGVDSIVRKAKESFDVIDGVVMDVGDLSALTMSEPRDTRRDCHEAYVVGMRLLRSLLPLMRAHPSVVFVVSAPADPWTVQPYECFDALRFAVAFIKHSFSELPPGVLANALVSDPPKVEQDRYSLETIRAICYLLSAVSRVSGGVLRAEAEHISVL